MGTSVVPIGNKATERGATVTTEVGWCIDIWRAKFQLEICGKKKKSKFCSPSSSLVPLEFLFLFGRAAQDVGVLAPQSGTEPLPPAMAHAASPGKPSFWILGSWILAPQFKSFWTRHSKWHRPAKKPSGQVSSDRSQEGNVIEGRGSCRKTPPERLSRLQPSRTGASEPDRSFPAEMDSQFANLS